MLWVGRFLTDWGRIGGPMMHSGKNEARWISLEKHPGLRSSWMIERGGGDQQRKEMEVGQTPGWVTRLGKR